jgi:regulator of protease activity HflC (stomatin/prohibitin superfamily)
MDTASLSNLLVCIGSLIIIIACVLLAGSIRNVEVHERFVVFRSGNYKGVRGPGFVFLMPIIDRHVTVDLREQIREVMVETTTREGTPVSVAISFTYKITDPYKSVVNKAEKSIVEAIVKDSDAAIHSFPLKDVLARIPLKQALNDRRQMISQSMGAEITAIEVKQVRENPGS